MGVRNQINWALEEFVKVDLQWHADMKFIGDRDSI